MTPPASIPISRSCVPEQPCKLKLLSSYSYMGSPSPVLYSLGSDCRKKGDFSKQRHTSTLLKLVSIYYRGTAEWLFLTLLRSTYFLHTFHNARLKAPIHWVMEAFAIRDFMEQSRTGYLSGALLSACIALVGGESKRRAICLFESLCGYMENTCKHTSCHLFTWFCIIQGETKHNKRGLGSDCHLGKLDVGQEEKVKTN